MRNKHTEFGPIVAIIVITTLIAIAGLSLLDQIQNKHNEYSSDAAIDAQTEQNSQSLRTEDVDAIVADLDVDIDSELADVENQEIEQLLDFSDLESLDIAF